MKVKKLLALTLCTAQLAALAVMPVNASAASSNVVADVDFENYTNAPAQIYTDTTLSDVHPLTDKGITYYSNVEKTAQESTADMYVINDGDEQFLRLYAAAFDEKGVDRRLTVPVQLDGTKSMAVEFKLRPTMATYADQQWSLRLLSLNGDSAKTETQALHLKGKDRLRRIENNDGNLNFGLPNDSWTTIKAVYTPVYDTDDSSTYLGYDVTYYVNGTEKCTNGTKWKSNGTDDGKLKTIENVIIGLYDNRTAVNQYYDFDDISVKYLGESRAKDTVVAADDFNSYTVAAKTNVHPATDGALKYYSNVGGTAQESPADMYVLSESGNKFLRLYAEAFDTTGKDRRITVPVALDGTKSMAVEFKLRPTMATYADQQWSLRLLSLNGDSAKTETQALHLKGKDRLRRIENNDGNLNFGLPNDSWTTIKAVYTPVYDTDESKTYLGYDVTYYVNGTEKCTNGTKWKSNGTDDGKLKTIENVIIGLYDNRTAIDQYYDFDDIKVQYINTNAFECKSTDLTSTTGVSTKLGSIKLTFSADVDDTTVGGITMTGSDSSTVALTPSVSGAEVTLTFGDLKQDVTYTITVPSTVKSKDDGTEAEEKTFTFKTMKNLVVDETFESYETTATEVNSENAVRPSTEGQLKYYTGSSTESTNDMYILTDGTNKFLRLYADHKDDIDIRLLVNLDGKDTLSVEFKVRPMNGTSYTNQIWNFKMLKVYDEAGKLVGKSGLEMKGSGRFRRYQDNDTFDLSLPTDKWTSVKAVFAPNAEASNQYYVTYYIESNGKQYTVTNSTVSNMNSSSGGYLDGLTKISQILIAGDYNNTTQTEYYDLDDIKVEYNPAPEFTCSSTSLTATTDVAADIGTITLTFSEDLDPATVAGITMAGTNGEVVPNYSVRAEDDKAILTFGGLEKETTYKITVPATVTSATGTAAKAAEYTFTTLSTMLVNETFEGYETTQAAIDSENAVRPNTTGKLKYYTKTKTESTDDMYILTDGTNKFLRLYADHKDDIAIKLPVSLDGTKSLSVEFDLKPMSAGYPDSQNWDMRMFRQGYETVNGSTGLHVKGVSRFRRWEDNSWQETLSTENWTNVKAVFIPNPEDENKYYVTYYINGEKKSTNASGSGSGKSDAPAYLNPVSELDGIELASFYNQANNNGTIIPGYYDIDNIKAEYLDAPVVTSTDITGGFVPITKQTIDFYFNVDMNSDTINDTNVAVWSNGNKVDTSSVVYFPTDNHMTVAFMDYLTPDTTYTVKFNNVTSAQGVYASKTYEFKTGSVDLTYVSAVLSNTKNGAEITAIPSDGKIYAKATVKNTTGTEGTALIILAAYAEGGKVLKLAQSVEANSKIAADGKEHTVYADIDLSSVTGVNQVKMYLWNGFGTMSPILSTPITLN